MNHRSLAFRLAAWYALLLSATFAMIGGGMFFGLQQYLRSTLRDSLYRRSEQVQQILQQAPADAHSSDIALAVETRVAPEFNNRFVRITRVPDTLIYRSGQPADHSFNAADVAALDVGRVGDGKAVTQLPLLISVRSVQAPSGEYTVELGSSLEALLALQDRLLVALGLLLPVLVICATGGGYLLVNRALRPVDDMSGTAEQMSLQNLDARLPVLPTGDALQRLSISLNHLLTRLRDSVQASRRFLADASHELRTPLTVIKGELQELAGSPAVDSAVSDRIGSVLEEVARLEHLVSGLLVLSRLDAGEPQREWVDVDLAELSDSTADQMRLMAEDRGIALRHESQRPTLVRADRARLKQVIVNLLDNAIRCTPAGGSVTLRSYSDSGGQVLEVSDTGIGIPAAALTQVFERFYRVDEARAREDGGAGLGLSIAKSICAAHGADIRVTSTLGQGSCFRVLFPSSLHQRPALNFLAAGEPAAVATSSSPAGGAT